MDDRGIPISFASSLDPAIKSRSQFTALFNQKTSFLAISLPAPRHGYRDYPKRRRQVLYDLFHIATKDYAINRTSLTFSVTAFDRIYSSTLSGERVHNLLRTLSGNEPNIFILDRPRGASFLQRPPQIF